MTRFSFVVALLSLWIGTVSYASTAVAQPSPTSTTPAANQNQLPTAGQQPALAPLIDAIKFKALIDGKQERCKILEPSADRSVFQAGHIPSAQFLHWVDDMTDPKNARCYNSPQAQPFAQLMSRLGIANEDRIIIYDRLDSRLSTRLYWTLKYFGHDRIQILDGGISSWEKQQYALSTETSQPKPSVYRVKSVRKELFAEMDYVKQQLGLVKTRLIDGRPPEQFSGQQPGRIFHTDQAHSRRGHIPGATNIFWADNFNEDGTFKSVDQLRKLYKEADIDPEHNVITYCNEGLHAAPPWFVLTQLLAYKDVRLYDSSMAEWAQSAMPMSRPPKAD